MFLSLEVCQQTSSHLGSFPFLYAPFRVHRGVLCVQRGVLCHPAGFLDNMHVSEGMDFFHVNKRVSLFTDVLSCQKTLSLVTCFCVKRRVFVSMDVFL